MRDRCGAVLGHLAHRIDRRHRRICQANIQRAGYPTDFCRDVYAHLGRVCLQVAALHRMPRARPQAQVRFHNSEHYAQAAQQGPCILVTAHMGNWEAMACAHALRSGRPLSVVGRRLDNAGADRFVRELRSQYNTDVIDKQRGLRQMLGALRQGRDLGILIDQALDPRQAVFVEFFGRQCTAVPVVSLLARRTGALVVPAWSWYDLRESRLHIQYQPALQLGHADPREETQQLTGIVEQAIRRHPEQWFWVHRRWKHEQESPQ